MNNISEVKKNPPERCVIILDEQLSPGRAANAAAVIALTIGQRHPELVGEVLIDASGEQHPGLIPIGISVLSASTDELTALRQRAVQTQEIEDIVDFPVQGQQTKNYAEFINAVAQTPLDALSYVGIALIGKKKTISKLVAKKNLFR